MNLAGFEKIAPQLAGVELSARNSWMMVSRLMPISWQELVTPLQGQLAAKDEQIKALTEAISALSKTGAQPQASTRPCSKATPRRRRLSLLRC